jgi:hypothetical protein
MAALVGFTVTVLLQFPPLTHRINVGGALDAVISIEVDTLRFELFDAINQLANLEPDQLVAGQSLLLGYPWGSESF